jgi:hypothetical protein
MAQPSPSEVDETKRNGDYVVMIWEMIWDKLGVRTDERNIFCWKLIIDGSLYSKMIRVILLNVY